MPSPIFCEMRCVWHFRSEILNHHYAQKSPEVIRAEFERSAVSFNSRILCSAALSAVCLQGSVSVSG